MTISAHAFLPLVPAPAEIDWSLVEPLQGFRPQFDYAVDQLVRTSIARWQARVIYRNLRDDERHLLLRFADHVSTHRPFWLTPPDAPLRGSFPSTELLGAAATVGAFWTGSTNRGIATDVDGARVSRTGATASSAVGLTTAATVTANATYAFRVVIEPGAGDTFSWNLGGGSTRFATTYGTSGAKTSGQRLTARLVPTAASMFVNVTDAINLNANWAQTGFYLMRGASLCRSFTVDGGSGALTQTGSGIYVQALPTSTTGLLVLGDMVEIVSAGFSQLVRVTENLDSDSSGDGFMRFEPQLRGAVTNNDLIVPLRSAVKMRMTEAPRKPTRTPGYQTDLEFTCEESF